MLSKGTRPDLAYNTYLSMKTKHGTIANMRKLNKIVKKAREDDSIVIPLKGLEKLKI